MTYFLFLAAIVLGFNFKKSRIVSVFMFSVMLILSVYKYNVADLENYQYEYISAAKGDAEQFKYMGHSFFVYICAKVGMTFQQYLIAYYFIILIIMYLAISHFTIYVNPVMSCYLIYPFGIDAIQMKTMMADAWILLGLAYLTQAKTNDNYKNIILFFLFSIIGSLFHFSVVFFIPIGVIFFTTNVRRNKRIIFLTVIIMFIMSYLDIIPKIIINICNYINVASVDYIVVWLNRNVRMGWIFPAVGIVLCAFCNYLVTKIQYKYASNYNDINFIRYFIFSGVLILPFLLYNATFIRILRVYIILLYIRLYNKKQKNSIGNIFVKTTISKGNFCICFSLMSLMVYMFWYEIYHYFDSTLGGILRFNEIFT